MTGVNVGPWPYKTLLNLRIYTNCMTLWLISIKPRLFLACRISRDLQL